MLDKEHKCIKWSQYDKYRDRKYDSKFVIIYQISKWWYFHLNIGSANVAVEVDLLSAVLIADFRIPEQRENK
jgi:hypothetical protein